MRKRILLALTAIALCCVAALAQAQCTFAEHSHDFGYIKEAKGAVTHTFTFTNTGDRPLIIKQVVVSCGCTRPEFPTKPIKPGKTGKVKITFSPAGRSGSFRKSIKVRTNGANGSVNLYITGNVIPKK